MRFIDSNKRRPPYHGFYYTEDSSGGRDLTHFDGHWHSKTGHPVNRWCDESNREEELEIALTDLLDAIPKQTEDADWWPDNLTEAVGNAKKLL